MVVRTLMGAQRGRNGNARPPSPLDLLRLPRPRVAAAGTMYTRISEPFPRCSAVPPTFKLARPRAWPCRASRVEGLPCRFSAQVFRSRSYQCAHSLKNLRMPAAREPSHR